MRDQGWAEEISLDLDMASAICPNCKILLVEASSNSFANLSAAVDRGSDDGSVGHLELVRRQRVLRRSQRPVTLQSPWRRHHRQFRRRRLRRRIPGGVAVRDGGRRDDPHAEFEHPRLRRVGLEWRRQRLQRVHHDPNTGVAVYDTYRLHPGGWLVFGGTSVAAPIIGGVYALAGNASSITYGSFSYSHQSSLFDILSGSNGSCGGSYLCTATSGYDGPTGNGTPNGTGAF